MPNGHQPQPTASFTTHIRARTPSTPLNLPQQLQNNVPTCAQSCVSTYISKDYTCSNNDLSCLCSQYSSEGFTLGELAFICLRLNCPSATTGDAVDVYNLCTAKSSAVRATHSTLTLPDNTSSATSTSSNSGSNGSSSKTTSTRSSSGSTVTSSAMPSASVSGASVTSVPSTSSHSPTATGTTGTSTGSTALTSAQAVGVSIAAFGAMVITIGLVYLIACARRRKAKKQKAERHSYDFVDEAPPRISPFNYSYADPRGLLGGFAKPRVELSSEKRNREWPCQRLQNSQYQQSQYQCHEKSIDRSPYLGRSISPESHDSNCSMRTTSQLLPERPHATASVPPRPPPKSLRPASVYTPATVFEEDRSPQLPHALMPGLPSHPAVNKTRQPHLATHYTRSPDQIRQPSLSIEIPRQHSRSETIQALGAFPMPPPAVIRPGDDIYRSSSGAHSKAHSSSTSLLNYYADPDSGSPDLYSSTPIDEGTQVRRPAPAAITITKPTYPPKAVRVSTASDTSRRTSFESTDPDEPTPPEEEDKRLTPVAESPIAAIRYPKVPRSSNQSVPRSPVYQLSPRLPTQVEDLHQTQNRGRRMVPATGPVTPDAQMTRGYAPTLSGSTLAAKRRGDSAAYDLERGLHITDYAVYTSHSLKNSHAKPKNRSGDSERRQSQRESPLKGYGRVASVVRREPAWPLTLDMQQEMKSPPLVKSPLWEPKLTPRREGDDLYLDIGVATPQNAHFQRY